MFERTHDSFTISTKYEKSFMTAPQNESRLFCKVCMLIAQKSVGKKNNGVYDNNLLSLVSFWCTCLGNPEINKSNIIFHSIS